MGDDDATVAPPVSEEDALFALPDHLNPKKQQQAAGEEDDEESASGGVLIWNTGIAEVELPESFAQKTVQATERALRQEEEARAARGRRHVDSSALPANFSTDFNRHRSDYVAELKTMRKGASLRLLLLVGRCGRRLTPGVTGFAAWLVRTDEQRERGFRKGTGNRHPMQDECGDSSLLTDDSCVCV